jgi:hypothetical protein
MFLKYQLLICSDFILIFRGQVLNQAISFKTPGQHDECNRDVTPVRVGCNNVFIVVEQLCDAVHGLTMNCLLLVSIPLGVLTVTKPGVAPTGTMAVRKVSDLTI